MDIVQQLVNQAYTITYKEIVLVSVVLAVFVLLAIFISKLGLFHHPRINQESFNKSNIVYLNVEGNDEVFFDTFKQITLDIKEHFQISNKFGYYYQDPAQAKKIKKCRATLGVIINDGEKHKIQNFVRTFPNYQRGVFPAASCLSVSYPYLNNLSYLLICSKVYPKLSDYTRKYELESDVCYLQIYNFLPESSKTIKILTPLEKQEQFKKW